MAFTAPGSDSKYGIALRTRTLRRQQRFITHKCLEFSFSLPLKGSGDCVLAVFVGLHLHAHPLQQSRVGRPGRSLLPPVRDAGQGMIAAAIASGSKYNDMSKELKNNADAGEQVNHKEPGPPHLSISVAAWEYGAMKVVADEAAQSLQQRAERCKKEMR